MILSNKYVKIIGALLCLLFLFACEVNYYEPLQQYVEAVQSGKTLQIRIDEEVTGHDSDPINFGYQLLGEVSDTYTITIENIGQIDLTVNTIVLDTGSIGGNPFYIDTSGLTQPFTLEPDTSADFTVVFQPSITGEHDTSIEGSIILGSSDSEYGNFQINLTGFGDNGETLQVTVDDTVMEDDSDPVDFGLEILGDTSSPVTMLLENVGHENITIDSITLDLGTITGTPFALDTGLSFPLTLFPSAEESIDIVFQPSVAVEHEAILIAQVEISYSDPDASDFTVNLTGQGTTIPVSEITVKRGNDDYTSNDTIYDFGSILVSPSTPPESVFEIKNTGTANLIISGIILTNSSNYSFSDSSTSATLEPGESIYKTISFNPQSAGTHDAQLSIVSTDSDENPFILKLTGSATSDASPEITVECESVEYFNNASPYNFGSVVENQISSTYLFTITNDGTADLAITSVVLGDTTNYSIGSSLDGSTIIPAGSASFNLTFYPKSTGTFASAVTIDSDDTDEDPFILNITGVGTENPVPEITVKRGGDDYTTNLTEYDFGSFLVGSGNPPETIFEIKNTGTADLIISGILINDSINYSFSDSTTTATLSSGNSIYKTITFNPQSAGVKDAQLSVISNDSDENPFILKLTGTGTVITNPDITVKAGAVEFFTGGASYDFGSLVEMTTSSAVSFTIYNEGTADLNITTLTLNDTTNYTLDNSLNGTTITAGSSDDFDLTFTPQSSGTWNTSISIDTDDPDEDPFVLNIAGQGTDTPVPEITVKYGTLEYTNDGLAYDYGTAEELIGSVHAAFTISNVGTANLNIASVVLDDTTNYTLGNSLDGTALSAGGSVNLNITFNPQSDGTFNADITIDTDDSDEDPFILNITGEGTPTPVPEIYVISGPDEYTSGGTSYDYGNVLTTESSPPEKIFEIRNTGTADLFITGIILNDTTNFSYSDATTTYTIAPDESIFKTVTFTPQTTGTKSANISFYTNDSDENPFILNIEGEGVILEITITESSVPYSNDGDPIEYGFQKLNETSGSKTVVIENTGTYALNIYTISLTEGVNDYDLDTPTTPPFVLAPGATENFTISFTPLSETVIPGEVTIGCDDPDNSGFKLNLTGEGDTGEITVLSGGVELENSAYFDVAENPATSDKIFTLRNDGNVDLVITDFADVVSPFSLVSPPVTPLTISAGASETITARFSPVSSGHFQGTISILSDDVDESTYAISMKAGTKAPFLPGVPLIWLNAEDISTGDTVDSSLTDSGGFDDFVASWPNSGSGADGTNQSGGGATAEAMRLPEYVSSVAGLNNKPAVEFVDANGDVNSGDHGDVMRIIGTNTYYENATIITVLRPTDPVVAAKTYMYGGSYTPYLRVYSTYFYNNINAVLSTVYSHTVAPSEDTTYCLTNRTQLWDDDPLTLDDSYRFWFNGAEITDGTNKITTRTSRFYNLHIGNHNSGFQNYGFRGYIPEVLIYTEALDEDVVTIIHDYLNEKYSIW